MKFITPSNEELSYLRADPLLWEQELDVRPEVAEAVEKAGGLRAGRVYWRSRHDHLYALELTGAPKEMAQGAVMTLRRLKEDPLAGQLAAQVAVVALGRPQRPGVFLKPEAVEELCVVLEKEVGRP